jgi:hypothetical protein
VVHGVMMARKKFQRLDIAALRDRDRHDECAEHIRADGIEPVGLRHCQDKVRLTELPLIGPARGGGKIVPIPFSGAAGHPALNNRQLRVGEPPLSGKIAVAGLRLPRRHVPALCDLGNLHRALTHLLVRHQAERRTPAGAVTGRAFVEDYRSNVSGEGDIADRLGCQASRVDHTGQRK